MPEYWDESHVIDLVSDLLTAGSNDQTALQGDQGSYFQMIVNWRFRQFLRWAFFYALGYKFKEAESLSKESHDGDPWRWLKDEIRKKDRESGADRAHVKARSIYLLDVKKNIENFERWPDNFRQYFGGTQRRLPLGVLSPRRISARRRLT